MLLAKTADAALVAGFVPLAVSAWLTDVAIPLTAALIAGLGVALPIVLVGRQESRKLTAQRDAERTREKSERKARLEREITDTLDYASALREYAQRLGLEDVTRPQTQAKIQLTTGQLVTLRGLADRVFRSLQSSPDIYDAFFGEELTSHRSRGKLVLLITELEARLHDVKTADDLRDPIIIFGIYALIYFSSREAGAPDGEAHEVLRLIARQDKEAKAFYDILIGEAHPVAR